MAQYMHGSAAVRLDQDEELLEVPAQRRAPRLTVVPGTRASQRAREHTEHALAPLVVTAFKCAGALAAVLVVASLVRILLISLAFGYASSNNAMLTSLDEARSAASELEVQQSVYGSPERVASLATNVYGMVPATSTVILDVTAQDAPAADGAQQTE